MRESKNPRPNQTPITPNDKKGGPRKIRLKIIVPNPYLASSEGFAVDYLS